MDSNYIVTLIILLNVYSVDCKRRNRKEKGIDEENVPGPGTCRLEVSCEGFTSAPFRVPIRGPRGPPGAPGPKGEKGERGIPGVPGEPEGEFSSDVGRSRGIAFFVGLQNNINSIKSSKDLIFENVVTNVGDAYDPETGRFTAPCNGTYQFTVVVAAQGRHKAAVTMKKSNPEMSNGEMVFRVWAESIPFWSTASNTAVLHLSQGQQIWLQVLQKASHLHGYMYTTWSGYILFSDAGEFCDI